MKKLVTVISGIQMVPIAEIEGIIDMLGLPETAFVTSMNGNEYTLLVSIEELNGKCDSIIPTNDIIRLLNVIRAYLCSAIWDDNTDIYSFTPSQK